MTEALDASVAKLRPMPSGVDTDAMSGADVPPPAWTQMPSTYVVCTDDRAVHPDTQREMAKHADDRVVWDTSHSPMLSRPDLVADLLAESILRTAQEGERDPAILQRMALLELQITPRG